MTPIPRVQGSLREYESDSLGAGSYISVVKYIIRRGSQDNGNDVGVLHPQKDGINMYIFEWSTINVARSQ